MLHCSTICALVDNVKLLFCNGFFSSRSLRDVEIRLIALTGCNRWGYELDMNLEQYRQAVGLTYDGLAQRLGLPYRAQARDYALGKIWPSAERLEAFLVTTGRVVTIDAMHQKCLEYRKKTFGVS